MLNGHASLLTIWRACRDDGHGGDAGEAKWFHLHAGEPLEMDGQWFVLKQVSNDVLPEFERAHH